MKFDPLHSMFSAAPTTVPLPDSVSHALLAAALVAELAEAVPSAQGRGFYLAVGRRMAAAEALEGVENLAQVAARVNAFWRATGWGEAEVVMDRDAIVVVHHNPPSPQGETPVGPWLGMLIAVMEGAYDAWFRRLGSGPTLQTRAEWKGDAIELRHGRLA